MPKVLRVHSNYTLEAVSLMGKLVRLARKKRNLTVQDLADRVGISRSLMQRIEKGDPRCAIGVVFEAAALVGVPLFESDSNRLASYAERIEDKLALLPKAVHQPRKAIDDDF